MSHVWHLASDADTDKPGQTKLIYSAHGEKELPGTRSTSTNTDDEKTLKSNTGGRNKAQVFYPKILYKDEMAHYKLHR